ncbi:rRNA biogenesis RRP36-like protein [Perilla frutescens var. hirtella]|nr:rRNA biogenesis RRP36-like protein [Perilla frutescens var. frutescens]KAH6800342.1 rRNA biogenesis RRP36-like protein [Perilla frutescens var. hirtella]
MISSRIEYYPTPAHNPKFSFPNSSFSQSHQLASSLRRRRREAGLKDNRAATIEQSATEAAQKVEGPVIVITGASRGIGQALALALGKPGCKMKKFEDTAATSTKIKFDDSDDHESSSSEDEDEIERELAAEVTFEELLRARSDGSDMVYRRPNPENKGGRANKNRPMEISSKKPVSRLREVIQVPKKVVRDPRFESLCGNLDVEGFKKRYNFIYENTFPAEKEELKKQMKKSKDPEAINELKGRISQIDKELKSAATKRTEKDILAEHKKKEREAAKKGKQPYYLKKSEIRTQKLAEKYKELKESGKLESFIEKKRRKNAAKDHRYIPYRRPMEQGDQ